MTMGRKHHHSLWTLLALAILLIRHSVSQITDDDLTISKQCESQCGDVKIPYPFGIGKGCYLNKWYEVTCNKSSSGKFLPFLSRINMEVVHISLSNSVSIKGPISSWGCSSQADSGFILNLTGSAFFVNDDNILVGVGCNGKATLRNAEPSSIGCQSTCVVGSNSSRDYCNGYKCCQQNLPSSETQVIGVTTESIDGTNDTTGGCRVAFLTDQTYTSSNISESHVFLADGSPTLELLWFIATEDLPQVSISDCFNKTNNEDIYPGICGCRSIILSGISCSVCGCNNGYSGNPYLDRGCKDIDECSNDSHPCGEHSHCVNTPGSYKCVPKKTIAIIIGVGSGFGCLVLVGGIYWLYKLIKKRKEINRKKKFFKRNGGLLLQQQLTSTEGNVEKTKIFNERELQKATNNFSLDRVLGQGGQGTVFKGMLMDGRIVAVKKSKVVDEDKLDEFINEVVILSQINHRNIVNLLGCCLETNVPLLVYEFIPNGNLFEHLHEGLDDYTMTWESRLRIAIEIAGALSYLHSAASSPVYHRDVKSTNILLDEKYRAKVSDFGTSRSVTVDHTHLTTIVSGTVGYVDPEYFQSSHFTDKSDVYSFGVVLVELITGEKPISLLGFQENRILATHFIAIMKENKLSDIIDDRISDGSKVDQVMAVANLARRCLNLKGSKRPNMREVSMELERIRSSQGDSLQISSGNEEEDEAEEVDIGDSWDIDVCVAATDMIVKSPTSLDVEPLFPRQTW